MDISSIKEAMKSTYLKFVKKLNKIMCLMNIYKYSIILIFLIIECKYSVFFSNNRKKIFQPIVFLFLFSQTKNGTRKCKINGDN